jgi:hypothetical protein
MTVQGSEFDMMMRGDFELVRLNGVVEWSVLDTDDST